MFSWGRKSIHESIISPQVDLGSLQKLTEGVIIVELGAEPPIACPFPLTTFEMWAQGFGGGLSTTAPVHEI